MTHVNPVGSYASIVSIVTTTSEMRLLKPRCWAPHGELPENPMVASIQHPPTPTPSVVGRDLKYRCKAVHSLPVSATSYFRHVVSTIQSSISSATTVWSSIDIGGDSLSIPSITITKFVSARSPFFLSFPMIHSPVTLS